MGKMLHGATSGFTGGEVREAAGKHISEKCMRAGRYAHEVSHESTFKGQQNFVLCNWQEHVCLT